MVSTDKLAKKMTSLFIMLALTGLILLSCRSGSQKTPTAVESITDSVASDDGTMIYYEVFGNSTNNIVLVHGWCMDRSYWEYQVADLKKDFKVVTIDLAGHGQSGTSRENWTIASLGADVAAVVNKLDLDKVVLIGHSMAGAINLEASRRLTGKVTALIGVDTYQDLGGKYTKEVMDDFIAPFEIDFPITAAVFARTLFPPGADTMLVEMIAKNMSIATPEIAVGIMKDLILYDAGPALSEVRIPIRCINSDLMPTNIVNNKELAYTFGVTIMPGYGHYPHLEDPAKFNILLEETLFEFFPNKTSR